MSMTSVLSSSGAPEVSSQLWRTLEVGHLLSAFRRRLRLFLALAILTALAVLAAAFLIKPVYTATARIRLDPNEHSVLDQEAAMRGGAPDQAMVDTELSVMRSRSVALSVVNDLDLAANPEFAAGRPTDVADNVLKHLKVEREGTTYVVALDVRSRNPVTAANVANAFANAYITTSAETRSATASKEVALLNQRLTALGAEVSAADDQVANYRANKGIATSTGTVGTVTDQQIGPLSTELATAKSQAAAADANAASARDLIARGGLDAVSGVLSSTVIADLQRQRTEVLRDQAEINSKYGPKHPQAIKVQHQLEQLNRQLHDEEEHIYSSLQAEASAADARAAKLQHDLDVLKGEQAVNMRASVEAESLQRQADAKRAMYNQLAQSAQQTTQAQHVDQPNARIIEDAVTPTSPSFPKKGLMAVLGVLLGVLVGASVVLSLELSDHGLRTVDDVDKGLGVPLIASAPRLTRRQLRIGGRQARAWDYVVAKPISGYAEVMRDIQGTVLRPGLNGAVKTIAVTSAFPGEGKTTCAVSLARIIAMSDARVILVDCDLRRNSLAALVQGSIKGGLLEVLDGRIAVDDAIVADSTPGLDVLPLREAAFTPRKILSSDRMAALIVELRLRYDVVVLDGPPILAVSDARSLSALADSILVIARWGKTPRQAVRAALDRLRDDGAKVAGIVLTQVNLQSPLQMNDPAYFYRSYRTYYRE